MSWLRHRHRHRHRHSHGRLKRLVLLGWIALGICAFLAYCPVARRGGGESATDGLGRGLEATPQWARVLLLGTRQWAGVEWLVADVGVVLGATFLTLLVCGRRMP